MIEPEEHLHPYAKVHHIEDYRGYIVWRSGPGKLVHIVNLAATEHRKGYGTSLVCEMLSRLNDEGKCHTVLGFTRERLIKAQLFYLALGFNLLKFPNLYSEGSGVIFSQTLTVLLIKNSNWIS